jgi:hypothetical protein
MRDIGALGSSSEMSGAKTGCESGLKQRVDFKWLHDRFAEKHTAAVLSSS